ncbi:hypothetical protein LXA43DRAFT_1011189, partial [Ganoderma leucocontextum]
MAWTMHELGQPMSVLVVHLTCPLLLQFRSVSLHLGLVRKVRFAAFKRVQYHCKASTAYDDIVFCFCSTFLSL